MLKNLQPLALRNGDALLIVDVQMDFLPGGRLAVPHGDEVIPLLNAYISTFSQSGLHIVATRDWHPVDHCSFNSHGGKWPPHCVAGSRGACISENLLLPFSSVIVSKATFPDTEADSCFDATELDGLLKNNGVDRIFIGGLATDDCMFNTVRDAQKFGYQTVLLHEAIRAVNEGAGERVRAIAALRQIEVMAGSLAQIKSAPPNYFAI